MTNAKKSTRKKAARKVTRKKAAAKTGKKAAAPKKATRKRAAKTTKAAVEKAPVPPKEKPDLSKQTMKMLGNREKHTPAVFKLPSKKNTPIVFSLEDVREVIKNRSKEQKNDDATRKPTKARVRKKAEKTIVNPVQVTEEAKEKRILGAASIADILGFNPTQTKNRQEDELSRVPRRLMKYYRLLKDLQNHVREGLDMHTKDTLKISGDDSADIAKYSQHMADAGTDNFDRDFALSLVSSEQEALHEIEDAMDRIFNGTYGKCEITGKAIARERLEAVPFTRFSLEGQAQFEKTKKKSSQRGSVFLESSVESGAQFTDDDSDD